MYCTYVIICLIYDPAKTHFQAPELRPSEIRTPFLGLFRRKKDGNPKTGLFTYLDMSQHLSKILQMSIPKFYEQTWTHFWQSSTYLKIYFNKCAWHSSHSHGPRMFRHLTVKALYQGWCWYLRRCERISRVDGAQICSQVPSHIAPPISLPWVFLYIDLHWEILAEFKGHSHLKWRNLYHVHGCFSCAKLRCKFCQVTSPLMVHLMHLASRCARCLPGSTWFLDVSYPPPTEHGDPFQI